MADRWQEICHELQAESTLPFPLAAKRIAELEAEVEGCRGVKIRAQQQRDALKAEVERLKGAVRHLSNALETATGSAAMVRSIIAIADREASKGEGDGSNA